MDLFDPDDLTYTLYGPSVTIADPHPRYVWVKDRKTGKLSLRGCPDGLFDVRPVDPRETAAQ